MDNGGGPDRARTGDLLNANQAFSQLNYRPSLGPYDNSKYKIKNAKLKFKIQNF